MDTKMDQPFYHDDSFLLGYGHGEALHDYKLQKPSPSLSLAEPYRSLKPDQYQSAGDAGSLMHAAPELERMVLHTGTGVMTTPTPAQYLYGRGITDEQEGFVDGFVKALNKLHQTGQMPPPNAAIGAGGVTTCAPPAPVFGSSLQPEPPIYTTLSSYCPAPGHPSATVSYLPENTHAFPHYPPLKEEPQTVPEMHSSDGSPPVSPIDMDTQERIKAERKRLRNRLAATKCRRRKLERIARLEEKVRALKSDNAGLSDTATALREQVAQLKQKVLRHMSSGCQLMLTSKMEAF